MMQGFYMLALQRARRQMRLAIIACILALVCAFFALRSHFSPVSVPTSADPAPYIAYDDGGLITVSRGGEIIIRTEIDTRSLPQPDREALNHGISLPDAQALAKLLEDYGS